MDAKAADLIYAIRTKLECSNPEPLSRFVGVDYSIIDGPAIECSQKVYLDSLDVPTGKIPKDPLPAGVNKEHDDTLLLDEIDKTQFRKHLGEIAYVAVNTCPDLAYGCSYLSRYMQNPTVKALRLLQSLIRYAKATSHRRITILPSTEGLERLNLTAHCDTSFGCPTTPHPQIGYVMLHHGVPVAWRSRKQPRVIRSTCKAETVTMEDTIDYLLYVRAGVSPIWRKVDLQLGTDAADMLALLASDHPRPAERSL